MSGELSNPRKSIIVGTLSSVFTGLGVYLLIAFWFARQATSEALVMDTNEWAAQKIMKTPYNPRIWKPSIVIPAENTDNFEKLSDMVKNMVFPSGRIYYLSAFPDKLISKSQKEAIENVLQPILEQILRYYMLCRFSETQMHK